MRGQFRRPDTLGSTGHNIPCRYKNHRKWKEDCFSPLGRTSAQSKNRVYIKRPARDMLPKNRRRRKDLAPHISRTAHSLVRVAPMVSVQFCRFFLRFYTDRPEVYEPRWRTNSRCRLRSHVTIAIDPPLLRLHLVVFLCCGNLVGILGAKEIAV